MGYQKNSLNQKVTNDEYMKILHSFWIGFSVFVILFTSIVAIIVHNTNQVDDLYYEKENVENNEKIMEVEDNKVVADSDWNYDEYKMAPFTIEEFWDLQVVNEEWYDNGIFSSYISTAYPTDTWEYSADIYPKMNKNQYGYTGFQIYTHQCEEAQQVYFYLVPISEAPAPVVYAYDEVSNTIKLVFSNGEILE